MVARSIVQRHPQAMEQGLRKTGTVTVRVQEQVTGTEQGIGAKAVDPVQLRQQGGGGISLALLLAPWK